MCQFYSSGISKYSTFVWLETSLTFYGIASGSMWRKIIWTWKNYMSLEEFLNRVKEVGISLSPCGLMVWKLPDANLQKKGRAKQKTLWTALSLTEFDVLYHGPCQNCNFFFYSIVLFLINCAAPDQAIPCVFLSCQSSPKPSYHFIFPLIRTL